MSEREPSVDEIVARRFGRRHENPCDDPSTLTCALWECQAQNKCARTKASRAALAAASKERGRMIDHAEYILSKIDPGADDLEPAKIVQGNLRDWYDEIVELRAALAESVKLQSHYAGLLNMHDGGQRIQFADAKAWIDRLRILEVDATIRRAKATAMGIDEPADLLPAPCPECGGDGGGESRPYDVDRTNGDPITHWIECVHCGGTGEVETQPIMMDDLEAALATAEKG